MSVSWKMKTLFNKQLLRYGLSVSVGCKLGIYTTVFCIFLLLRIWKIYSPSLSLVLLFVELVYVFSLRLNPRVYESILSFAFFCRVSRERVKSLLSCVTSYRYAERAREEEEEEEETRKVGRRQIKSEARE